MIFQLLVINKKHENFEFFLLIGFILNFSLSSAQQTYEVKPFESYLEIYKSQYKMIYSSIESRTDLTLSEKLQLLTTELNKIKSKFKIERKAEYESKSVELSVTNSCTKGSSGGKKDCGYKYVNAPLPSFYTKPEWVRIEDTDKGRDIKADGSSAGLRMTIAGKGRNEGTLFAVFRYRPEYIAVSVESDAENLFNLIIK